MNPSLFFGGSTIVVAEWFANSFIVIIMFESSMAQNFFHAASALFIIVFALFSR